MIIVITALRIFLAFLVTAATRTLSKPRKPHASHLRADPQPGTTLVSATMAGPFTDEMVAFSIPQVEILCTTSPSTS